MWKENVQTNIEYHGTYEEKESQRENTISSIAYIKACELAKTNHHAKDSSRNYTTMQWLKQSTRIFIPS